MIAGDGHPPSRANQATNQRRDNIESNSQKDIPSIAESMIQEGKRTDPENLLKDFVSEIPPDWKPMTVSETTINIAYWTMEEFIIHA